MFLSSVGEESEVDVFAFFLADRLGMKVSDLDGMAHSEYVAWQSFHKVKRQQEQLAAKAASRG